MANPARNATRSRRRPTAAGEAIGRKGPSFNLEEKSSCRFSADAGGGIALCNSWLMVAGFGVPFDVKRRDPRDRFRFASAFPLQHGSRSIGREPPPLRRLRKNQPSPPQEPPGATWSRADGGRLRGFRNREYNDSPASSLRWSSPIVEQPPRAGPV